MSTSSSSRQAADRLSHPSQQGTLAYAYRRSVVALQNVFGASNGSSSEYAEREPLLSNGQQTEDYGAAEGSNSAARRRIRKPKKIVSQSKVEAKVWFANERTWISWLRVSLLIGSFAIALFNSSSFFTHHHHEPNGDIPAHHYPTAGTIKTFGAVYASIAILTLLWGLYSYQRRVTLIKSKHPGDFDDLIGPPLICAAMFIAVLFNFVIRVQQHNIEDEP